VYVVEPMTLDDVDEVVEIEREAFTLTWPSNAYRRELRENRMARYVVLRDEPSLPETPEPRPAPADGDRGLSRLFERVSRRRILTRPAGSEEPAPAARSPILGYAGLWLMADEAHITTIATRQDQRGKGLGELLLIAMFRIAEAAGASQLTLEVRVSNAVAQRLYQKYGFTVAGTRRHYYSDNGEDALIMWSETIGSPRWRPQFAQLTADLAYRLGQPIDDGALAPLKRRS
jgi:ribosomal-protein-alanine N-acetyltransferase